MIIKTFHPNGLMEQHRLLGNQFINTDDIITLDEQELTMRKKQMFVDCHWLECHLCGKDFKVKEELIGGHITTSKADICGWMHVKCFEQDEQSNWYPCGCGG